MATRAAIAAKDREVKKDIAKKELAHKKKELDQRKKEADMEHWRESWKAAGTVARGAGSLLTKNDPNWYKKYNVTNVMAQVPTFFRAGLPIKPEWLWSHSSGVDACFDNLPGVMVYRYYPLLPNGYAAFTVGAQYYKDSPINATLTRFMAELRKLNSRIGDYDPADIGFYFYALSDIMEGILELIRAVKIYNTWYAANANFAKLMLRAAGFDPDDFIANYNEFKALAHKLIQQFNSCAVLPSSLTFLLRRAWMASVIVRDHDSPTAQLYMFRRYCNVELNEDETGLQIVTVKGAATYAVFRNNILGQMESLFNSVGMVTITADLRAAFPENTLYKISDFEPGEGIVYSTSETDLEQLHNIQTLPIKFSEFMKKDSYPADLTYLSIGQDPNGYLYQGQYSGGNVTPINLPYTGFSSGQLQGLANHAMTAVNVTKFLNFYKSEPVNEDDIIDATRLRFVGGASGAINGYVPAYCGTEVVGYGEVWVRDYADGTFHFFPFATDILSDQYEVIALEKTALLSRFDWLPMYRHITYIIPESGSPTIFYGTVGEIDHAVQFSDLNVKWLHEGCAFSEFFIDSSEFKQARY